MLDHGRIDADLTKEGIDHTSFWNIWRLTPQVYRHKKDDEWLVKHEPQKSNVDGIKDRAGYVLADTVAVLLAQQINRRMWKGIKYEGYHVAKLRHLKTTVYAKADKTSVVAGTTPDGLTEIMIDYSTPGLKGDGQYWSVFHFEKGGPFLIGFVIEDDLDFS